MTASGADSPPFRLYGAERSYFTGKARPALRAKRLYFEEILPTPEAYRDILQRTGMIFIPVVVTPEDETWQDTSDIIDALEARFPEPALIPATPVQRIVSYLFEVYADEFMLLPAMHYRWSAPEAEKDARGAFAALSSPRTGTCRLSPFSEYTASAMRSLTSGFSTRKRRAFSRP